MSQHIVHKEMSALARLTFYENYSLNLFKCHGCPNRVFALKRVEFRENVYNGLSAGTEAIYFFNNK